MTFQLEGIWNRRDVEGVKSSEGVKPHSRCKQFYDVQLRMQVCCEKSSDSPGQNGRKRRKLRGASFSIGIVVVGRFSDC